MCQTRILLHLRGQGQGRSESGCNQSDEEVNLVQAKPVHALYVHCGSRGVWINDNFGTLLLRFLPLPQFPLEQRFSLSSSPPWDPTRISISSPLRCDPHPQAPQSNPFGSVLKGLVSLTLGWGSRKVFQSSANDRKATFIPSFPRSWQERWNVDRERCSHLSGQQLLCGMGSINVQDFQSALRIPARRLHRSTGERLTLITPHSPRVIPAHESTAKARLGGLGCEKGDGGDKTRSACFGKS